MRNLVYVSLISLIFLTNGCGKKSNPEFKTEKNLTINEII